MHAWSDSMIVLHWLHGDPSRWKSFVSNRTMEILNVLPADKWKHVRGIENPADLISRRVTPIQLQNNLWWEGPEWLSESRMAINQSVNDDSVWHNGRRVV